MHGTLSLLSIILAIKSFNKVNNKILSGLFLLLSMSISPVIFTFVFVLLFLSFFEEKNYYSFIKNFLFFIFIIFLYMFIIKIFLISFIKFFYLLESYITLISNTHHRKSNIHYSLHIVVIYILTFFFHIPNINVFIPFFFFN